MKRVIVVGVDHDAERSGGRSGRGCRGSFRTAIAHRVFAVDDRGESFGFTRQTDTEETVSAAQYRGEVLVVNFNVSSAPSQR